MRSVSGFAWLAFVIIGATAIESAAQDEATTAPARIDKGRITLTDASRILFSDGQLDGQAVSYTRAGAQADESTALEKVLRVERQKGTHALAYALVCGVGAGVGALMGVSANSNDDVEVSAGTKTAIVGALTGVGVLIGAVIGGAQKRYEVVYENPALQRLGEAPAAPVSGPPGVRLALATVRF